MLAKPHSLRGRLLVTATLVLIVFLGLMGLVIDQAFHRSAEQGVSERLMIHVYGLLAVTEVEDTRLLMPDLMQEPGFNTLGSGLYGLVLDERGVEIWRSVSALDRRFAESSYESLVLDALQSFAPLRQFVSGRFQGRRHPIRFLGPFLPSDAVLGANVRRGVQLGRGGVGRVRR